MAKSVSLTTRRLIPFPVLFTLLLLISSSCAWVHDRSGREVKGARVAREWHDGVPLERRGLSDGAEAEFYRKRRSEDAAGSPFLKVVLRNDDRKRNPAPAPAPAATAVALDQLLIARDAAAAAQITQAPSLDVALAVIKRQNDGQIAALSGQLASLSGASRAVSQASQQVSQQSQQLSQSVDQLNRQLSQTQQQLASVSARADANQQSAQAASQAAQAASRSADAAQQSADAAQQSAASAVASASSSADAAIAAAITSAQSSASSVVSANLASVTSSAGVSAAAVIAAASQSAKTIMDNAASMVKQAQADATAVRTEADTRVQQAQGAAVSVTQAALAIIGAIIGSSLLTIVGFALILRYRRQKRRRSRLAALSKIGYPEKPGTGYAASSIYTSNENAPGRDSSSRDGPGLTFGPNGFPADFKQDVTRPATVATATMMSGAGNAGGVGFATSDYSNEESNNRPTSFHLRTPPKGKFSLFPRRTESPEDPLATGVSPPAGPPADRSEPESPQRQSRTFPSLESWLKAGTVSPFGTLNGALPSGPAANKKAVGTSGLR